jgi:hypothetical protein
MMAPIFKKLAQQVGTDKAVFCKVDTNTMYKISSKYQILSLPTFVFFVGSHKWNQFSGAGEAQLQQMTHQAIRQAELENVVLERNALTEYYNQVDSSKTNESVEAVHKKCVDMNKRSKAYAWEHPPISWLAAWFQYRGNNHARHFSGQGTGQGRTMYHESFCRLWSLQRTRRGQCLLGIVRKR